MSSRPTSMPAAAEARRATGNLATDRDDEALLAFRTISRALLPAPIVHAGGRVGDFQEPLHPAEAPFVKDSVARRVREFTAGRACARRVLARLGHEDAPVRMGPRREPLWPAGVVGSISHGAGYCIAAACRRQDFASIGVDIETSNPLSPTLMDLVCTPGERLWCEQQGSALAGLLGKFVFSIKESVFKCLYPVFQEELEFSEVRLDISMHEERFLARVSRFALGSTDDIMLSGRFACTPDVVMTSAVLHESDIASLPVDPGLYVPQMISPRRVPRDVPWEH